MEPQRQILPCAHSQLNNHFLLSQGTPVELRGGRILRFAASTRQYRLSKQGAGAGGQSGMPRAAAQSASSSAFSAPPPPKRQKSDPTSAASGSSQADGLSSLAGYSEGPNSPDADGAAPASDPQQRASLGSVPKDGSAEGRFARAVKYTVQQPDADDSGGGGGSEHADANGKAARGDPPSRRSSEEQSRRKSWLLTQQPKARTGGLYGTLPPPTSSGTPV